MKKVFLFLGFAATVGTFQFCSSSRKTQSSTPRVTYAANVQQLVTGHCAPCHVGASAKQTRLDSYDAAKTNIDDIIRRIQLSPNEKGFMPMRHPKLPDSTIQAFVLWKSEGLPQ